MLPSLQSVRERAAGFCKVRQWERFHVPTSLTLALSGDIVKCDLKMEILYTNLTGECGEVSEIFQWKETMLSLIRSDQIPLSEAEMIHVGEEIADVLIYSTRLCDVCSLDLAHATKCTIYGLPFLNLRCDSASPWDDVSFSEVQTTIKAIKQYESHRMVSLQLQAQVGKVCEVFSRRSEVENSPGLVEWSQEDLHTLAHALSSIVLLLCVLANMVNLSVGKIVADKFAKNEAKYPASLSKGSSAKYTAYSKSFGVSFFSVAIVAAVALAGISGFAIGRRF